MPVLSPALKRFEEASRRYQPDSIRLLFIAEAPPAFRVNRLFYFTGLTNGDALFLEMMKVLYPAEAGFIGESFQPGYSVKKMRSEKEGLLRRFYADGCFLIDASQQPMPDGATTSIKIMKMTSQLPHLRQRLERLLRHRDVPIILIGGVTYSVCAAPLRDDGWKILNNSMINHPARGNQILFRSKLRALLSERLQLEITQLCSAAGRRDLR